ncbi:L-type lectin-domain containing protein [Actinoplanes sp. NPDC051411]|uniref:L-type lectin-domain containing protein n=1 Tax=Actinoplanes sp. NPDC051411 TaxID=3155522 RepID=UPI00343498E1
MSSSRFSRIIRGGLTTVLALGIAATAAPAGALAAGDGNPLVDFPSFNGASRMLDRNGTADIIIPAGQRHQRILRLTTGGFRQAGSAWAKPKIDLSQSFESTFKVYLHHSDPGADGIAFLVQTEGPRALGGWGGGLGYRGIKRSVAVEFDTFQNSPDPNNNHLAVVLDGNPDVHTAVGTPSMPLYGRPFYARVAYDAPAKTLSVYVKAFRAGSPEQLVLQQPIDLATAAGGSSAWIGFTAGTGTELSKQDIYSWSVQGAEA